MKSTVFNRSLSALVVAGMLMLTPGLSADSWKQYRGQAHDGTTKETGFLKKWPSKGLKRVWKVKIGQGFSSTVINKNRLYTMFGDKATDKEYLAAYNTSNGKMLWKVDIGKYFPEEFGDGPRATPLIEGNMIYCLSSRGQFAAVNLKGKKVWEIDFIKKYGSKVPRYGFCCSPVVMGNTVMVEVGGGKGKAIAGFDKKTGKELWITGDGTVTYCSPAIVTMNGKKQAVFANFANIYSFDAKGKLNWKLKSGLRRPTAMPLYIGDNKFFFSEVSRVGSTLVSISGEGDKAAAKQIWKSRRLKNDWTSSVYYKGHIYGFDNATLRCITADKAEVKWSKRGFGKGSLIVVEDKLLVLSDKGVLAQVDADPAVYKETGRFQAIEGKCWSEPSVSNGRLYIRNVQEMVCYKLK